MLGTMYPEIRFPIMVWLLQWLLLGLFKNYPYFLPWWCCCPHTTKLPSSNPFAEPVAAYWLLLIIIINSRRNTSSKVKKWGPPITLSFGGAMTGCGVLGPRGPCATPSSARAPSDTKDDFCLIRLVGANRFRTPDYTAIRRCYRFIESKKE